MSEPHIPIDMILARFVRAGCGIDLLVRVEKTNASVAIIAGVRPGHLADLAGFNGFMRDPVRIVGRAIGPHLKHFSGALHGIAQLNRLLDGVCHRLFAIDVFA